MSSLMESLCFQESFTPHVFYNDNMRSLQGHSHVMPTLPSDPPANPSSVFLSLAASSSGGVF